MKDLFCLSNGSELLHQKVFRRAGLIACASVVLSLNVRASGNSAEMLNMVTQSSQQSSAVRGVVEDGAGPVAGVTVLLKGTPNGSVTDVSGNFILQNVKKGSVLVVSSVGYLTQEVTYSGQQSLRITLKENAKLLEELVVVGFGTQKKENLTGAVSVVTSDAIDSRPVQNVSQALQGVVPGLNFSVNSGGGTLDNVLDVSVRGAGTIGEGSKSSPLILIDGMEGNMNAINPNDILTISVLKDAASSAIYGSRAAFGVILITTKSGKAGRTSINYSANTRFVDALAVPKMLDSKMFALYFNRAAENDGQSPVFSAEVMDRIIAYQKGELKDPTLPTTEGRWRNYDGSNANTDWFKEQYRDWVPSQEHNLSISGGSEKITYLLSGNLLDQNGLIRHGGDNFKRYSLNGRFNAKLNEYITLSYNTKWIREEYDRPSYMTPLFFHNIARRWPTSPVYDNNGYYMEGVEIIQMRDGGRDKSQKDYTFNQLQLIVEPITNWKIYLEGNMNTTTRFNHKDVLPVYAHDANGKPYLFSWDGRAAGQSTVSESANKENFLTTNIYTDYFKELSGGHFIKAMLGFNAELMKTRNLSGSMDELTTPGVPTINTATKNPRTSGGYAHWATSGFFGRLNYNYKEKFLLETNLRYDGSSRFIGDKRWTLFPSVSAGYNVAREDFFKELTSQISTLKLRTSWGQLGNMNTNKFYPFSLSMPVGTANGEWLIDGVKPSTANAPGIVSSLLTWETVESWNIGLDWAAFGNRLTGSFDYFNRMTKNMIGPAPELPSILGTGVPKINNADMESYGFELELNWRDRIKDFNYGVKMVLSDDRQKITRYPNEKGDLGQWYAGRMNGEIWGYESVGIAKSQKEMDTHLASLSKGGQDAIGSQWGAGDIMYKDLNGDNKIDAGSGTLENPGDKRIIGNSTPRYRFGITLDASWNGFDISLFFQGVAKRDYMLGGPYFWGATGGQWQSVGFKEHWDFFRPEGDPLGANLDSYYPRPLFTSNKNYETQTRYLQNAAYIRLKNAQIGYTFPKNWVSKVGLQSVRLYVSGDNIWTASKITGIFDPETLAGGWGDGKLYPLSRTISFGLNVNF